MADPSKNGNGSVARRIIEPLIVAAVVGLMVMYGTVRILETKMDSIITTVVETRQAQKDDIRDMTEIKARLAVIETKQNRAQEREFDNSAWERRKR
jgi:outer membrane murein-binding lipoprotein Lpp